MKTVNDICPDCLGRGVIIPLGYQGEPTDCPTCAKPTKKIKKLNYVFRVALLSCSGNGQWIERCTVKQSNDCKTPLVALAGNIASHYLKTTETGIKVCFVGLQEDGKQGAPITEMNPFEMTVIRNLNVL